PQRPRPFPRFNLRTWRRFRRRPHQDDQDETSSIPEEVLRWEWSGAISSERVCAVTTSERVQ
ncbi:MAG: hypothetical protein ACPIOQ_12635, partial [Promethearchaeia archaeon]